MVGTRGRVQGSILSLPSRRFAKGKWVSRRRYRKRALSTQTSWSSLDFSRRSRRDDVGAETGGGGKGGRGLVIGSVGRKTSSQQWSPKSEPKLEGIVSRARKVT